MATSQLFWILFGSVLFSAKTTKSISAMAAPNTMSAVVCTGYTGYAEVDESKVTVQTIAVPTCGPKDVLIKVSGASVNPIDWKVVSGALKAFMPKTFPTVLGFEAAGVVEEVGGEVTGLARGDAVWTDATRGCYAEFVAVPAEKVGPAPRNLSAEEAAVVPLAGLTSLQALRAVGAAAGSRVLILGGSGGTGSSAIQIAKSLGCHVTTTCSGRNAEFVKSLGADRVVNYREARWWEELKDLDAVYDCVGEADTFPHAQVVLKDGGKFATIAAMGVEGFAWERGVTGAFILTNSSTGDDLTTLKGLCESGALRPSIHKTFPLADIWGAIKESKSGRVVGKIAISV